MTKSIKTQTNFLVAEKIGSQWKKVGLVSYTGKSFESCNYELPVEICQAIGKACRWYLDQDNAVRDIDFVVSEYPGCEFRVTAY